MKITQEQTGKLTAQLKVEISANDYADKVDKVLKEHQRRAAMPGFRPGKVPYGLVKKMYGHAVMADEVNKLVNESLMDYLNEQKVNIIGHPLANHEKTSEINWHESSDFTLWFDLGMAPEFELVLDNSIDVEFLKINADDDTVNQEVTHLRERHGDIEHPEQAGENDWLDGEMEQMDEQGHEVKGGIKTKSYLFLKNITNADQRAQFIALTPGQSFEFDIRKVYDTDKDIARVLRITESKASHVHGNFRFTLEKISRMVPAAMTPEFYERVFPGHSDMDEEHFLGHIRQQIEQSYAGESDKLFLQSAIEKLIEANPFDLPDEFLKRWLLENSKKETSPEAIEEDYPSMMNGFKWDIIRQKIDEKYGLAVDDDQIKEYVADYFSHRYGHQVDVDPARIQAVVNGFMEKKEEVEKVRDELFGKKLLATLQNNLKVKVKEVTLEEFILTGTKKTKNS